MQKVSFQFEDILNDLITAVNGQQLSTPLLPKDFVYNDPNMAYWIEMSNRGIFQLCTNLSLFTDQELTVTGASSSYTTKANEFIGGRPDDRIRK